ncbi:MAG: divalent-cation tolerance protein CutA [Vicinamibacterales bacterium]
MTLPTEPQIVLVLTTLDADVDASPLARTLVEERLAACVNILPTMQSIYWWKGSVESAEERQLVIKTSIERLEALKNRLRELHPYEVPEVVVIGAAGSASYEAWLKESTSP